jgi:hypothetical protein
VKRLAIVSPLAIALVATSPAHAKFPITLRLSDATPVVTQPVRVVIRIPAEHAGGAKMRLVAVPPGVDKYAAIRAESRYGVKLTRDGAAWRGVVRFGRAGRWLLVVPNWGAPGYAIPPPVIRKVRVSA